MPNVLVDRQEEVFKFVRGYWKVLVSEDFPEKIYKESRRSHFFVELQNKVGIPKDTEIAQAALDYLFKINYFKTEDKLQKVLALPFFSKNVSDPEYYFQKFRMTTQKVDLDLASFQSEEYKAAKIIELEKKLLQERSKEIDEKIKQKQEEYDSLPSVLDTNTEYPEPIEVEEENTDEAYLPWWQKLRLRADPFSTIDGLGSIRQEDYEEIIIKTSIYEKYVSYIRNTPSELFKLVNKYVTN